MSAEGPEFKPCSNVSCGHALCDEIRRIKARGLSDSLERAFAALFDAAHHHCQDCKSKHREALMESLEPLAKLRGEIRTRESGGN